MTVTNSGKCEVCKGEVRDLEAQTGSLGGRVVHIECRRIGDLTDRIRALKDGIHLAPVIMIGTISLLGLPFLNTRSAVESAGIVLMAIYAICGLCLHRQEMIKELNELEKKPIFPLT
jgi:hypothetical protein